MMMNNILTSRGLCRNNLQTTESLNQGLSMVNFPDYEYFKDVGIAYSDFIQHITSAINKIAPFKEIRIKNYSHDWFDCEILDKIIQKTKSLLFCQLQRMKF